MRWPRSPRARKYELRRAQTWQRKSHLAAAPPAKTFLSSKHTTTRSIAQVPAVGLVTLMHPSWTRPAAQIYLTAVAHHGRVLLVAMHPYMGSFQTTHKLVEDVCMSNLMLGSRIISWKVYQQTSSSPDCSRAPRRLQASQGARLVQETFTHSSSSLPQPLSSPPPAPLAWP
jgi:hypothetical protein